ncbi:dihydrolipoamide acetyltransferase family protein [Paenibacillus tyrfis]|uniref:Dihydrolipoamide acetyltransferase component of pyruvate dehydrogenase complex n=1 Tax=Paenibacillus tyrfis TaxID=1501230 RepID=A0A081NT55_9BACL|nr:dihydrolipoamide acetyltransferase family protein [Paenibacillus tyrfis]KEQ21628.1 branched-chain alpha-keto acid dehydrogenase subunit E2 [Paenibacillus tyrfis]
MLKEVFMPKLGMTMETGTITRWFVKEGDAVSQGDVLLEVLTDKINIEVEAYHSGIFLKRYYDEDAVVPVNHVIGYIGDAGDQAPDSPPNAAGAADVADGASEAASAGAPEAGHAAAETNVPAGGKPRATPAARTAAREHGVELHLVQGSGENGRIHRADVESFVSAEAASEARATPLARKIASESGLALTQVEGSGDRGKIRREDVERALNARADAPTAEKRVIKLQGMRKIIAQRMSQSAYTAPHVTITTTVDMTAAKAMRAELLPVIEKQTGLRLSYTEILLKAVSACLVKHPNLNARWKEEEVVLHEDANIGLAVSVKDGLLVPVISQAQQLGLAGLVKKSKELAAKARDNQLKPEDLTGGTFTVSNLGMYAVDSFTPIINQPEVAILGVGQIQEKPAVIHGELKVCPMMTLSLSFDHRVVDGAPAAAFLTDLKTMLEQPYYLLI